jgi:hypothetical protein
MTNNTGLTTGSIRSPDDGQGTPETCRDVLSKITRLK